MDARRQSQSWELLINIICELSANFVPFQMNYLFDLVLYMKSCGKAENLFALVISFFVL